jgi:predicted nucleic acid-binding protein
LEKIIIDTNIILSSLLSNEKNLEILNDYRQKTKSEFLLPQIVFEELLSQYERSLEEKIKKYTTSIDNLNKILYSKNHFKNSLKINKRTECNLYKESFFKKFKISENEILNYKNDFLPELVRRANYRIKPSSENKEEFRDCILWLTIKELANEKSREQIVFISNNIKEFADDTKQNLHRYLNSEIKSLESSVHYLNSFEEFIQQKSKKVNFITTKFINSHLDVKYIHYYIKKFLQKYTIDHIQEIFPTAKLTSSDLEFNKFEMSNDFDFYIYEFSDDKYTLKLKYNGEASIMTSFYLGTLDYSQLERALSNLKNHQLVSFLFRITISVDIIKEDIEYEFRNYNADDIEVKIYVA